MAETLPPGWSIEPPSEPDLPPGWSTEPPTAAPSRSVGEAALTGLKNVPASAAHFARDIAQPFIHPIATEQALSNLGKGVLEKVGRLVGLTTPDEHIKYADAVGQFLKDRYGSTEAVKNTLATDPVGMAADVSLVLSGGGTAAARLPGALGRVGEVAATAGRVTNPLTTAGKVVGTTAKAVPLVVGELTGTGGESLRIAGRAGYEGGQAGKAFTEHMRGTAPMEEAVQDAQKAVAQLRQERGAAYQVGMGPVKADTTVLNFNDIDASLRNMQRVKQYAGRSGTGPVQNLSPETGAIRQRMTDAIEAWKQLDPAEFHTPEGLDALKQQLGEIYETTEHGTPARKVAGDIYNAVRSTIIKQAPVYGQVMKDYEEASSAIKEIEGTLSLNPNARIDTALRKLQSVLRNNVHTNYGQRVKLVDYLVRSGAPHLMEKLAGQSLSSLTPRGLGKLISADAAIHLGASKILPLMSPRLMGETAYRLGRTASPLKYVPPGIIGTGANVLRAGGVDALSGQPEDGLR